MTRINKLLGLSCGLCMVLFVASTGAQSIGGVEGMSDAQIKALAERYGDSSSPSRLPSGLSSETESTTPMAFTPPNVQSLDAAAAQRPRVVEPGSALIVELLPSSSRPDEVGRPEKRYLVADGNGEVNLAEYGRFKVMGYTETEVASRLSAAPRLATFDINVLLLPSDRSSREQLRPFGAEVFGHRNVTPQATDLNQAPVSDYVYGPGDSLIVQYYGKTNDVYELVVLRDGLINLPDLGPMRVAGMTFDEIKTRVADSVAEGLIGVRASVSAGALRQIGVLVVGEVRRPGVVKVPAGSSVIDVIYAAGGLMDSASYRSLVLRREGASSRSIDLYPFLTRGESSTDLKVRQEDVLVVKAAGPRVSVLGEVRKPAQYEIDQGATVGQVLTLAGGLSDQSSREFVIDRLSSSGEVDVISGSLGDVGHSLSLMRGDVVRFTRALSRKQDAVELSGHFENPGSREWSPGMTLGQLLTDGREFMPRADVHYVLILRERGASRERSVISANFDKIMRGESADVPLQARDEIVALPLDDRRSDTMRKLIERINGEGRYRHQPTVRIEGAVRFPGTYFYEEGQSLDSLITVAGGTLESAMTDQVELVRYVVGKEGRESRKRQVSLSDAVIPESLQLQPDDIVNVFTVPDWSEPMFVEVRGEVLFPGRYPITKGERLSDLLQRVGGVSETGYLEGAMLQRERLKEREREELRRLRQRLSDDLRSLAVQADATPDEQEGLTTARALLLETEGAEPLGRLVIDFDEVYDGGSDDIVLHDGDTLTVPPKLETVSVIGEVNMTVSHRWRAGHGPDYYLERSGGITTRANESQSYIVRASGEVRALDKGWFGRYPEIKPGDTIVVPLNTDRIRPIQLARDITQILSQIAITVAAFNSVGVF